MIDITISLDIPAPPDAVWAVLADYRRDPEWRTGVVSMQPDTPGLAAPGTTVQEVLRLAGQTKQIDSVVDTVDPGTRLTWHTTAGAGADARGVRLLEPLGDNRCRVTLGMTVTPHGAEKLLAPVFRRLLRRNQTGDLRRLRTLVRDSPSRAVA